MLFVMVPFRLVCGLPVWLGSSCISTGEGSLSLSMMEGGGE